MNKLKEWAACALIGFAAAVFFIVLSALVVMAVVRLHKKAPLQMKQLQSSWQTPHYS